MWGLVITGAAGGACAAARPSAVAIGSTAEPVDLAPPGVDGVAEIAARQWLLEESQSDHPRVATSLTIDHTSVVSTRRSSAHSWTVTVAVTLRPADGAPATWYLEIGVSSTAHGLRPIGAPTVVPPPVDPSPLPPPSAALQVPAPDDELANTAEAFLQALLTGGGDPVRYASPHATPFHPTGEPFADLELERIGVLSSHGERTRIRVSTRATTPDGIGFDLIYELQLRSRDGRWEVESLASTSRPPADRSEPLSSSTTTTSTAARTPGA